MANTKGSNNPFPSILVVEGTEPTAPSAGQQRLYIDSTTHKLKRTDSSGTDVTIEAASGLSDPMTTRGDVIVRDASNVTARLAIGSTGKVLSSNGTDVSWQTPASGAATNLASARYVRTTANYTTTSTTFVDVDSTNLALTITTGARRVSIGVVASVSNSGTNNVFLDLLVDGTSESGGVGVVLSKSASLNDPISLTWLSAVLTAASHTFKLQWKTAAGTATLYGGQAGGPVMQFWVAEMYVA
jgi:hypothetical protein